MNPRRNRHTFATVVLTVALGACLASPAFAQSTDERPPASTIQVPASKPNLDKIRDGVEKPAQLVLDDGKMRFYVEILAKWPTFSEIVKGYDLRNGPTPRGGMTHQEFLAMVTPREMYGSGGIRPGEMLQWALVNWAGKALISKSIEAIKNARSEREIEEIRARIDRELAALRGIR